MTISDVVNENVFLKIKTFCFSWSTPYGPDVLHTCVTDSMKFLYKTIPRRWLLDVPYSLCIYFVE